MEEEKDNFREKMYEAIQGSASHEKNLEGSVLTGYVIMAEWRSPDGLQWLTKLSGDAFEPLTPWRERMFGLELLNWENTAGFTVELDDQGDEEDE